MHGEGPVLDAVGVAPYDGAEVGVSGLGIVEVLGGVVIAQDHVLRFAVLVVHIEFRQSRAIGDEGRVYAGGTYCVLLEVACAARGLRRRLQRDGQ